MPASAQTNPVTGTNFLVEDVERASAFCVGFLGFVPRRRAPGFAEFRGAGIMPAPWEIAHIASSTGVLGLRTPGHSQGLRGHRACNARPCRRRLRRAEPGRHSLPGPASHIRLERALLLLRRPRRQPSGALRSG